MVEFLQQYALELIFGGMFALIALAIGIVAVQVCLNTRRLKNPARQTPREYETLNKQRQEIDE